MKCPNCQHENPDTQKFCGECGAKLEKLCPSCGVSNLPQYKFCGECGHNLTLPTFSHESTPKELSFDEKIDKIQRYLPKGLTEKILSQRDKIEGERKQVTVMFCDMEGFAALSERIGPEEAYSIMDQVYEILIHRVHDYEGTVNEMTGDGIMALFGAPIALEDAPQRAIRSAYSIHREMTRLTDKIRQEKEGIRPFKMRIGIHTGPVVVGTLGNDLRVEFKAVGDTVNLASRMEGLAEPGTTYVTEDVFRSTEGLFRFEALGKRNIKGKKKSIDIYRVIATSSRRTRFDVSAERGLTPFVGKERELELLLDGLERVKAGHGQAFSIVAEAGLGKSRLLYEFRKAVANEDVTFLEGKCLSYSRGVAYHPVVDILKSNYNIREDDGDSEIREKVKKGLKTIGADEASSLPYLLELLSVKDSGFSKISMSPESRKDRTIEALNRNALLGSEIRPIIMAVEDLHWIDKSSEERFKYLLNSISGARIFLIFTYRPEFVHTWSGKSYHSQINLNRLSNRESLSMISHLLGTDAINQDLQDLILEKAEGIPFFIEEFIKSLKELRLIERGDTRYHLVKDIQDMAIPSTIQDVIMARVDSLSEGAKKVLQTGSVIEREFSYVLIKRVTNLSEREILSNLSLLKDSELLYERGIYPETTYVFKHALTREVVYNSLLAKQKKILHEKTGNAIEGLYVENIREYYGVLADHYIEGQNYEKGGKYSRLASSKARKSAFFGEAIFYGKNRIICLEQLPRIDDVVKRIIDARVTLGLYYHQMTMLDEAKEIVEPIIEPALKSGYKKRISQIHAILGTYYSWVEEDQQKALQNLTIAINRAEELNDFASLWAANHWIGHVYSDNCEFQRALYHIEKALEIVELANVLWSIAIMKSCIAINVYNAEGRINLAYKTSQEAIEIAEESDDTLSKADAYVQHGIICYHKGFLDEAKKYLLEGSVLGKRINYIAYSIVADFFLGKLYFEREEYQTSQDHFNNGILTMEKDRPWPSYLNAFKIELVAAKVMNNEKDIDLKMLNKYEEKNGKKLWEGHIARCIGEILLNVDNHHFPDAEHWINKAIKSDKRNGRMWELGKDHSVYAQILKRKGNHSKAKEKLNKAIEIFKECGADGWVEKYEKELAAL